MRQDVPSEAERLGWMDAVRLNLRKINQLIREAWAKGQAAAVSGRGPKSASYAWSERIARDYFPDIEPQHVTRIAKGEARLYWDAEKREVAIVPTNVTEKEDDTMKPCIRLFLERADGHQSKAEIEGSPVTSDMLDSAEDLLHTLTTGERPIITNLYDVVAKAFGTTREDAKLRIATATYGKQGKPITARDQDRIAEGDLACALSDPQTPHQIRIQLPIIRDAIAALQSLDDLGEEGNRRAEESLHTLEKRYEVLQERLKDTKQQ